MGHGRPFWADACGRRSTWHTRNESAHRNAAMEERETHIAARAKTPGKAKLIWLSVRVVGLSMLFCFLVQAVSRHQAGLRLAGGVLPTILPGTKPPKPPRWRGRATNTPRGDHLTLQVILPWPTDTSKLHCQCQVLTDSRAVDSETLCRQPPCDPDPTPATVPCRLCGTVPPPPDTLREADRPAGLFHSGRGRAHRPTSE